MPFRNQVFKKPEFKKISDVIWEIPKSFKQGMKVPVRVIATKKLVDEMDLQVYDQASNVATLPGIQKYSFIMPDGHSGYGFCVSPETKVLSEFGYFMQIKDFESRWENMQVKCYNEDNKMIEETSIKRFLKIKPKNKVLRILTKSGQRLTATEDHPFFTQDGMKPLNSISIGEKVAVCPFEGVQYETPQSDAIISEENMKDKLLKLGITADSKRFQIILNKLNQRDLLPLTFDNPKLPYILKIMGFLFGDGTMNFIGKKSDGILAFFGRKEDLEDARKDIIKIGYTPSKVYIRKRGEYEVAFFYVNASSLLILFETLGVPRGRKTNQTFSIPKWIYDCKLWQKRLFLAALFGSELRAPHIRVGRKGNFGAPVFYTAKLKDLEWNAIEYLSDITKLLNDFGVKITKIQKHREIVTSKGEVSSQMELVISSVEENLINLWNNVGFEYNNKRRYLANISLQYLKLKKEAIKQKKLVLQKLAELKKKGWKYAEISDEIGLSVRMVKYFHLKSLRDGELILATSRKNFPSFVDFVTDSTKNLDQSGLVWDEIKEIKEVNYDDNVYDFTVFHKNHNFVANTFLVSNCIGGVAAVDINDSGVISPGGIGFDVNCGMRLLLTNLTYDQVKPHLKTLVDKLFEKIPAGVGGQGFVKLTKPEFKKVLEEGGQWAVNNGYGWKEDLERTELNGIAEWADVSKVSSKAIERGYNQIGTLGSGNHYVEIQWVKPENIFDAKLAKKWGIFPNQVVIMFHTGSRGEGHQIATDYLQIFLGVMERKYGIKILDRELACAPFNSPEGQDYWKAMACAVNFSFANRQTIAHRIREAFSEVLKQDAESLGMHQVFDISHNRATLEKHKVDGELKELLIHRKGATGSYPAGREEIPKLYRDDGSPVIIGGSMETGSYLLVGGPNAAETFMSTAHGSGRTMSRTKATKIFRGQQLFDDMLKRGIYVKSVSWSGLAEEAGAAYKNIEDVIEATHLAGISKKVVRFLPIGNVKG